MGEYIVALIPPLAGVIVGFFLSQGVDFVKKRRLIKRYSAVLHFELKRLKEDIPDGLDGVIHRYDQLAAVQQGTNTDTNTEIVPAGQNPSDFLKRWNFRNKYRFLSNNFEKISLFNGDTIKAILKIYSYLEEFEEYKQISISDPRSLESIGMGDPEHLLIGNLRKAQNEIPNALAFLERE
jgi:hypothetical protein